MSTIQMSAKISAVLEHVANQTVNKILVPIDFSPAASVALDYAVAIAKALGSEITVYHSVTPTTDLMLASGSAFLEQETDKLVKQVTRQVETIITPYQTISYEAKNSFLHIDSLVKLGYITNDIDELTTSSGYDLVVVGTKGVSGIDEVVFGSNANSISEVAKCPVLIVPEKAAFKGINNIVYATEFTKNDTIILDELLTFAEYFGAELTCLHINTKADVVSDDLLQLTELEERYWFTPINKLRFELVSGESVLKTLFQYLDEQKPDIITVLRKDRSFIGRLLHKSISKKLAFHSKTPILIIQEKK